MTGNRVLRALAPEDRRKLAPCLKDRVLQRDDVLFEAGQPITHVYFLHAGLVSLEVMSQTGVLVEATTIGREGVVGLGGLLAGDVSFTRQVVELPGHASAIDRRSFLEALESSPSMRRIISQYSDSFTAQLIQLAVCNVLHDSVERLSRGLLQIVDRNGSEILLTQEILGTMLGVRRSTVTLAARALQTAGLISYRRGRIVVLDRSGLEELTCECYRIITDLQSRLPEKSQQQS